MGNSCENTKRVILEAWSSLSKKEIRHE